MENVIRERYKTGEVMNFVLPSIAGVLLLMTPFKIDGNSTVMVSVLSKQINSIISSIVPIHYLVIVAIAISCFLALIYKIARPQWIERNDLLKQVSDISGFWLAVRLLGMAMAIVVALKIGPEVIWGEDTGGLILYDLICGLFTIFLVAGFILPLLTEFGLLEYVGVFLTAVMRPVFKLPGRSAVDCVASWIGDGTIGVALTNKQYEEGYYNAREAAVISTTFSAVSITFCLVVLDNVGLLDYFGAYYLTVALAGIACALIVPRIPPLSNKPKTYFNNNKQEIGEDIPSGFTRGQWGLYMAIKKAKSNGNFGQYMKNGGKTVLSLWLGVTPVIMAAGTLALIISATTPVFEWLGLPFYPILKFFGVPEAKAASGTMVVGFADMVVPSILAAEIPNRMTKFIVAAISVTQLIYMSETGAVILGSNLPVKLSDLFILFIERTLISIPVVVIMAHLIF